MPKIRNIIIFISIGAVLVLVYIFFIKPSFEDTGNLISSPATLPVSSGVASDNSLIAQDFLPLLLGVRDIKLNDSIFSDVAFTSLDGSHGITLTQDGTEGRPNPFAPLGSDVVISTDAGNTGASNNTGVKTLP